MGRNDILLHFPCLYIDTPLHSAYADSDALIRSPRIESFATMTIDKLLRDDDRTSDECMGVGLDVEERHSVLVNMAAMYLRSSSETDLNAAGREVQGKLSAFVVSLWFCSHHRN